MFNSGQPVLSLHERVARHRPARSANTRRLVTISGWMTVDFPSDRNGLLDLRFIVMPPGLDVPVSNRTALRQLENMKPDTITVASGSELPLLGSNQDSPDPMPLRLSPPLNPLSVRGLDCAFTFAVTRSGGSHPVSTPSPLGAWLGVASQGSADFENIHSRRFRRGVQRVRRRASLESGVLPVTPRGSAIAPVGRRASGPEPDSSSGPITLQRADSWPRVRDRREPVFPSGRDAHREASALPRVSSSLWARRT